MLVDITVWLGQTFLQHNLKQQIYFLQVNNLLSYIICVIYGACMYLDPPLPPLIITVPVVNLTINNYNLTMKCLPDKNNFDYKWIRKNDVLPSRAQGINTSQLTIVNLKPEDSGDYQCVMSNSTGTISSNYSTVSITGKKRSNLLDSYNQVFNCSISTNNFRATK